MLPVVGARGMYAIAGVAAGLAVLVLLPLLAKGTASDAQAVASPETAP